MKPNYQLLAKITIATLMMLFATCSALAYTPDDRSSVDFSIGASAYTPDARSSVDFSLTPDVSLTPIEWSYTLNNTAVNHNLSVIYNETLAVGQSVTCSLQNFSSNDSVFVPNNTTGNILLLGSNISLTGNYDITFTASDNCSTVLSQQVLVNITNTEPVNTWYENNQTFNHNVSRVFGDYCSDPDNDAITYTLNDTSKVTILANGSIQYTANINLTSTSWVQVNCSDTNLDSLSNFYLNIQNTRPTANATITNNSDYEGALLQGVCGGTDPDNDLFYYSWTLYSNGTTNQTGTTGQATVQNVNVVNITAVQSFEYNLTCEANDTLLGLTGSFLTGVFSPLSDVTPTPCANVSGLYFDANISRGSYNPSNNQYTESDILVTNTSICGYTFVLNNTADVSVDYTAFTNLTRTDLYYNISGNVVNKTKNTTFTVGASSHTKINVSLYLTNFTLNVSTIDTPLDWVEVAS